ncbi:MAG: DUF192 domain-containing protein [Proteobacteria bacterium]|nr:DUF192 domain-containing protein [Pseudomonadota bacterium]
MNCKHLRRLVIVAAFVAGGIVAPAAAQLPVVQVRAGMHLVRAELAADFASRMQGLMHRPAMGRNDGMLFVFDEVSAHCMWMKNTLIPLSVAFLDERGAVINVADMTPHSEQSHCASRPARYALEMNRGWFTDRGIGPGMRLGGIPGARPTK